MESTCKKKYRSEIIVMNKIEIMEILGVLKTSDAFESHRLIGKMIEQLNG